MVANPEFREAGNNAGLHMGAMRSILVALDGSAPSLAALQQAVNWALALGAELRGIFVEDEWRFVYYPSAAFEGGMSSPIPLPEKKLAQEIEAVNLDGEAIRQAFDAAVAGKLDNAHLTIVRGNVNDILTAEARAVDLVVMGKRGRNDPPDSNKPGPTTEALIHDALRPVLVVPVSSNPEGGVLLAYDGSISANRVLVPGTQLAKVAGLAVNVLCVNEDQAACEALHETVKKYFQPHGVESVFQSVKGKPAKEIIRAARGFRCGLIVMGAFGHGPIRQLVFGSSTLDVLENTPCPVLLMV
jgi:nucleotide-binding universal stress UspA family protein